MHLAYFLKDVHLFPLHPAAMAKGADLLEVPGAAGNCWALPGSPKSSLELLRTVGGSCRGMLATAGTCQELLGTAEFLEPISWILTFLGSSELGTAAGARSWG